MGIRVVEDYSEAMRKSKITPFLALVFLVDPSLHARIEEVQLVLKKVDPRHIHHVGDYLHVTVKQLGWRNENVRDTDLPAILEIVQSELESAHPFDVTLSGVANFPDVLYLKVIDPSGSIDSINRRLIERLGDIVPRFPFEGDRFVPHVTIATFTARDVRPLLMEATRLATRSVGTMRVSKLHLVRFYPHLAYGTARDQVNAIRPDRTFVVG